MNGTRALVVDDEASICQAVRAILESEGIAVRTTLSSPEAFELIMREKFDLIISDLKMPGMSGIELFEKTRSFSPDSIFIIITAYGTIRSAVGAVKKGIYDYIPKPFTPDEVRAPVRKALEKLTAERESAAMAGRHAERYSFQSMIGNSAEIHELFRIMRHAASSDSNVLLTGESGSGKELVARAIHSNSVRARKKFITVNCGAIPEGLLESELFGYVRGAFSGAVSDKKGLIEEADKGTLFLDEIGEMAMTLQVKLLRLLQDGEFFRLGDTTSRRVNMRIIAATNKDLKKAIIERQFREDLYYRLNVIPIELPPLRKRKGDIPLLANHFLQKHAGKGQGKTVSGFSREALQILVNYDFPGNIRELENAVEYAIAFSRSDLIEKEDLPDYIMNVGGTGKEKRPLSSVPLREAKFQFEKEVIISALLKSGGNVSEAARHLNIHRQNLQQKIRLLGIDPDSLFSRK
ncbi:MAG TPA: sigma-54 dependent transcriptional regulator [Dissulfurispiraceae bacterium]|nr:sigma-54 dependent transcriptional regulator [Dissulfurispiraceae bacterium]